MAIWACIVGVPAIATFTLVPELDLVVSRQFALGESDFSGLHSNLALFMRTMFRAIFVLCCAVAAAGLALVTWLIYVPAARRHFMDSSPESARLRAPRPSGRRDR
jgi:hypothetical protein